MHSASGQFMILAALPINNLLLKYLDAFYLTPNLIAMRPFSSAGSDIQKAIHFEGELKQCRTIKNPGFTLGLGWFSDRVMPFHKMAKPLGG